MKVELSQAEIELLLAVFASIQIPAAAARVVVGLLDKLEQAQNELPDSANSGL